MKPLITQFGKTETSITFSPDPGGDKTMALITERRRIHIDTDEIGKRSAVLKDDDGRVIAVLVG